MKYVRGDNDTSTKKLAGNMDVKEKQISRT